MAETLGETRNILASAAAAEEHALASEFALRDAAATGLDGRTAGLVRIAVLIALDAPPATYARQVTTALDGGATPEDILLVLRAVSALVGSARVVAAAPELMLALGMTMHEGD